MKNIIYFLAFLLVCSVAETKQLSIDIDGAMFKKNETENIWEMYYAYPDTVLKYEYKDGKYAGALYFSVIISDEGEEIVTEKWIVDYFSAEPVRDYKMTLTGQKNFVVPHGELRAEITVMDYNDRNTKAVTSVNIISPDFSVSNLNTSMIQLAQIIEPTGSSESAWSNKFLKNNIYVVPNPSSVFIQSEPKIYVYSEIYTNDSISGDLNVRYSIFNSLKKLVLSETVNITEYDRNLPYPMPYQLPVDSLPSGSYFVAVKAWTENGSDSVDVYKKFYLVNPNIPPEQVLLFSESASFEKSEFITMSTERIELEYKQFQCIAEPHEAETFEELDTDEAKRRALYKFWLSRDTDTTTAINETREEFRERVRYSNAYFSFGGSDNGWNTDRGRIYIRYGEPTQRDRYMRSYEQNAYEEWFYSDIEGGIHFYFVDIQGFSNYLLVHSDAIGFLQNENWYDEYVNKSSIKSTDYE